MSRICLTCSNSNKLDAERMFIAGKSISEISRTFGIPYESLRLHMADHLSRQLVQSTRKSQALQATDMLQSIEDLITRTKHILDLAETKGQYGLALSAIGEARQGYQLLCQIAVAMHAARQQELEAVQDNDQSQANEEYSKKLGVLTIPELEMLQKLSEKMENQDRSMIIIPENESIDAFTPMKRTNLPKRSLEEETPVNRSISPVLTDIETIEESWQPEPWQKVSWINGRPQKPVQNDKYSPGSW